jgi:heme-degrading monooxygenase HmoA
MDQPSPIEGSRIMKIEKIRGQAIAASLVLMLHSMWLAPAHAQSERSFSELLNQAKAHPGVLGIETGETSSGKVVIFAWFENKEALVSWYKSDVHQRAMKIAFPKRTFDREPLPDLPADSGQILAIVSLKRRDTPVPEGASPAATIGIELYTPLPGGVAVGDRFAPKGIKVPGLREVDVGTAESPRR